MQNVLCTEMTGTQHVFEEIVVFRNLFLHCGSEAQVFQLAQGGLQAVLAAVNGDGLVGQGNFKLQIDVGEGIGDALDAVFAHHVGNGDFEHGTQILSFIWLISVW